MCALFGCCYVMSICSHLFYIPNIPKKFVEQIRLAGNVGIEANKEILISNIVLLVSNKKKKTEISLYHVVVMCTFFLVFRNGQVNLLHS